MMDKTEQQILQKHLARFIIDDVFNTVTDGDILKVLAPNVWQHKNKRLTEGQVNALRNEARAFNESALWLILKDELMWHAQKKTVDKAVSEGDLIACKMLMYLIKTVQDKLDEMSKA